MLESRSKIFDALDGLEAELKQNKNKIIERSEKQKKLA